MNQELMRSQSLPDPCSTQSPSTSEVLKNLLGSGPFPFWDSPLYL